MINWLHRIWDWLKKRIKKSKQIAPSGTVVTEESRPRINLRPKPVLPIVNMPRYQPCKLGHGWKRRKEKTVGGATYWCNKCRNMFFVRAHV